MSLSIDPDQVVSRSQQYDSGNHEDASTRKEMLVLQLAVLTILLCTEAAITGVEGSHQPERNSGSSSVKIHRPLHEDINSSVDEEDETASQEDSHDYPVQHKREGGIILSDKETFSFPEKNGINDLTGHEPASLNEERPALSKFLRPMIYGPLSLDGGNLVNSHRRSDEGNVSSTMKRETSTVSCSRHVTQEETTRTTVQRSSRSVSYFTSTYTNKNQLNVHSTTEPKYMKLKDGEEKDNLNQFEDKSSSSLGGQDTVARIDSDKNEDYFRSSVDNYSKFHPELKQKTSNINPQFHDNGGLMKDLPFEDEDNHASEIFKFKNDKQTVLAGDENFLSMLNSASRTLLENIVDSNQLAGESPCLSCSRRNLDKTHHPFQRNDISRVKVQWSGSIELEPENSKPSDKDTSVRRHRNSNETDEVETTTHSDSKRSNRKTVTISWKKNTVKIGRDTIQKDRHRQRGLNFKRAPLKQHGIRQMKPKQTEHEQDSTLVNHGSRQERQSSSDDIGTLTLPAQIQDYKKRHKMKKLLYPTHSPRRKRVEVLKKRNNIVSSENYPLTTLAFQYAARKNRQPHSNNDTSIRRSNNGLNRSMLRGSLPQKEYARSRKYINIKAETDPRHLAAHRITRTSNESSEQSGINPFPDQDLLPDAVNTLAANTPQPAAVDFKVTPLFPMFAPEPESFTALISERVEKRRSLTNNKEMRAT